MRNSKSDFMVAIAKNAHDMHELKNKYKYLYNYYERSKFFDIARAINRHNPVEICESKNLINENNLYKSFLSSLEEFDSDFIYDYY